MKAEDERSVALAEGVLELVPVSPLLDGRDDRLELDRFEPAEPPQRLVDLAGLLGELVLVGQRLPGSPGARLALVDTAVRDPVRAGFDQLEGARLGEASLDLRQACADTVAGQPAGDEHHVAVGARDASPALGERVDVQDELLAPLRWRSVFGLRCGHRPYRCSTLAFDLDRYRARAERFGEELSREYYLHLAGRKRELEIERIYDSYADLFTRESVMALRELASAGNGDGGRRLAYLLHFGFEGLVGLETRSESAELAGLEASLEVDAGDGSIPYRAVVIAQANEVDGGRRAALEEARNAGLGERLNPIYRIALDRAHEICGEFAWSSYAEAYTELRGIDLERLRDQTARFLEDTEGLYSPLVDDQLQRAGLPELGALRRSDLPRFFRAAELDDRFPAADLVGSFESTLAGLGIDVAGQENVHLDTESRPTKSPRAFCSTPRVPDEVYLVIAPTGGRDDYGSLFHEGGHTEHYANTAADLPFEFRQLGDNSVTESFAFLLEHLVADGAWLRERLGIRDPEAAVEHTRAFRLVMIRRYAAKLAYELELHGPSADLTAMPGRYAELLSGAVRVPWPRISWLADVDDGFYAACYLRAWALETHWRAALRERFGERWFARREAGQWLRGLWRHGQRLNADELLAETLGEELDFSRLARSV